MIKTLRIISVATAVLAVAVVFCAAAFGADSDAQIKKYLDSPDAIEEFKKTSRNKSKTTESEVSPLVKAAQAFALYLNPPAAPASKSRKKTKAGRPKAVPRPSAPVSAKFNLIGTSYHPTRPEMSLALIDQSGKGFRWVRQSARIGHLIIEKIKDGVVVIRDGQKTQELVPSRPVRRSLIKGKGAPVSGKTDFKAALKALSIAETGIESAGEPEPMPVGSPRPSRQVSQVDEEKAALMNKFVENLRAMKAAGSDDFNSQLNDEKSQALIDKIMSDLRTSRVSPEEAGKLQRLGKELKSQDSPQAKEQESSRAKDRKVQRSKRLKQRRRSRRR